MNEVGSKVNLVVGCGISGAVIARLLAEKFNEKVVVIDKKSHIAGSCYDYRDENGICIHKYGSHIFHTNFDVVWEFLNRFTKFNNYEHKVLALIDGKEVNIPFNFNSLYKVFDNELATRLEQKLLKNFEQNTKVPILEFQKQEDDDLKNLADYIYEKVFLYYTTKQWGLAPKDIDKSVTARVPVYIGRDDRYFNDKYQGIPVDGYTKMIENILDHPNITVQLETDYKDVDSENFTRIFYTGSIDEFFNYEYGKLPYRSLCFEFEEYEKEYYQDCAVVNYTTSEQFTRIHEYKYYLNDKSDKTVVVKEYSQQFEEDKNERYYPISNDLNNSLYNKYVERAKNIKNLWFLGRLGDYKYYDIDKAVLRAIKLIEEIQNK